MTLNINSSDEYKRLTKTWALVLLGLTVPRWTRHRSRLQYKVLLRPKGLAFRYSIAPAINGLNEEFLVDSIYTCTGTASSRDIPLDQDDDEVVQACLYHDLEY